MNKIALFLAITMVLLRPEILAQTGNPLGPQRSCTITVPPWKASGLPEGWQAAKRPESWHHCAGAGSQARGKDAEYGLHADGWLEDGARDGTASKAASLASLGLGRMLVGNNYTIGAPADNSMAISNSGFIVSADNTTIDFYSDAPDTLVQFQFHATFYNDTLLGHVPFDPRVIYDRYADRFIVVMALNTISSTSQLLVSFSKSDDPRDGWNHYRIHTDTLTEGQWLDFPQVAVNKDELFIVGNMVDDVTFQPESNKLFQIKKSDGYDSLGLSVRIWPDILDASGEKAIFLCPLSDGMMSESYARGVYLTSTEFVSQGQMGTQLYWYHLTDSLGALGTTINSYRLGSGVPYEPPLVGAQLGNADLLDLGNSRVQSGFHLNGKLYFVYCKNTNGYCTVVLNRIDIANNTLERDGWGFSAGGQDDSFPSIAFSGRDSSEAGKLMMCYQRSGSNIFAQMRAVCFDSVFATNSILVRQGDGYIDNNASGLLERFGDYTCIQRRYGAASPTCWAVASYPVGANGNYFNNYYGFNAFIAEFTDSLANAIEEYSAGSTGIRFFPNPCHERLNLRREGNGPKMVGLRLMNLEGKTLLDWDLAWGRDDVEVALPELPAGSYILCVKLNNERHEAYKLEID